MSVVIYPTMIKPSSASFCQDTPRQISWPKQLTTTLSLQEGGEGAASCGGCGSCAAARQAGQRGGSFQAGLTGAFSWQSPALRPGTPSPCSARVYHQPGLQVSGWLKPRDHQVERCKGVQIFDSSKWGFMLAGHNLLTRDPLRSATTPQRGVVRRRLRAGRTARTSRPRRAGGLLTTWLRPGAAQTHQMLMMRMRRMRRSSPHPPPRQILMR